MGSVKTTLDLHGLGEFWANPEQAAVMAAPKWKTLVYDAVDARSNACRMMSLAGKPSASTYQHQRLGPEQGELFVLYG